ncbi:hypothetical protein HOD38_01360 [archaeon]|jgi:sugar-specific transcriptional regulator TrmB|nr:hypothetical protein [archaeon]MBT4396892.1 hypothetical protein [archaeon]MBT4441430.1 hypothetical protein [archaeon]
MINTLRKLGFTEGEIKVYRSLIILKEATIGPISKKSKVTPSKTYPILEKLLEKGLISKVTKDKTQYFIANNPERLLTYLEEKKIEIDEQKEEVKKEIKKLSILELSKTPNARVLTGIGGIKTFYEEFNHRLLKEDKIFKVFSFEDDWEREEVKKFIQKQDLIRKELGIEVRVIANERIKKFIKSTSYKLVKIKFTDQKIPIGTVVSNNLIALMSWKEEPFIVVIESEELGKSYTQFFDELWKQSKL